ncbi:hypothetical protein N9L08_08365 [Rhodobacteraceae bacterium]|nr:hypothetical protein [Paracoccaceae bacterium]
MSEWLYQIRIKTSEVLSSDLRGARTMALSQAVLKIAEQNGMQLVCTFDAFREYCEEAERKDIAQYHLYDWTKAAIENPEKKAKHLKSFAFYLGNEQVYSKAYASVVEKSLQNLGEAMHLIEITMIDSNPANNPQPPS